MPRIVGKSQQDSIDDGVIGRGCFDARLFIGHVSSTASEVPR
jgi:hypothetical protein